MYTLDKTWLTLEIQTSKFYFLIAYRARKMQEFRPTKHLRKKVSTYFRLK